MESKFITIWGTEPGAGRKTIAQALAPALAVKGTTTLLVMIDPSLQSTSGFTHDPEVWVPRFKNLSALMLRNYLAASLPGLGRLILHEFPKPQVVEALIPLVQRAFDWVLCVTPVDWSASAMSLLDRSDFLLWVAQNNAVSKTHFKEYREQLAARHFPHAFSQVVLNRVHLPSTVERHAAPDWPVLATILDETVPGVALHQGIQNLAQTLQGVETFSVRRSGVAIAGDASADKVVETLRARIQPQLLQALESAQAVPVDVAQKTLETCLAEDSTLASTREARTEIYNRVLDDVLGLGPLEPLLKDPDVSEIMVNGKGALFVEKKGKLYASDVTFSSDTQLRTIIDRIVAPIGRRVDESMPLCDARLADGSRVNIVLPPLALDGAVITIRKFMTRKLDLNELIHFQSLSPAMAELLRAGILLRKNIVVSGGTGSGKTTLLNALSSLIPDDERIVTIEDAAELRLQKPHVVRLESRPPNAEGEGAIPIRRLVINALRMRPDRIVVGECRGGEALDMLQAMNTGHDGSLTTVHANSPRDALSRLETLVLMAGMELPIRVVREQIRSAVHLIVQQSRLHDGSRKIISITEVTGMEGDTLTTQELFHYQDGEFQNTGILPTFAREMRKP